MEHLPPRSPDEEPHGPDHDRLDPGEIDLTGTVRQDDALADVIGDAIGEAESGNGEVPDRGARSLARALANERDDPLNGALHHFAATGRADPEAIAQELADLYETTDDDQIKDWINRLGTYVIRLPDAPTEQAAPPDEIHKDQEPELGTSAEGFFEGIRHASAEADAPNAAEVAEPDVDESELDYSDGEPSEDAEVELVAT